MPDTKVTKILDNKSALVEIENSGWKFFSEDGVVGIETGLLLWKEKISIKKIKIFLFQVLHKKMIR